MASRALLGFVLFLSSQAGLAAPTFWNLFNIEGENTQNSVYITYASLEDMLTDSNRTGSFVPNTSGGSARNVVGSGSDGIVVAIVIDIKPGSDLNCFNVDGHGVLSVAVIGSDDLDVQNINVESLRFGGLKVRVRGNKAALCSFEYINDDEIPDLVCQFDDDPDSWEPGEGEAALTGELYDGTRFKGTDSICIVP